LPRLLVKQVLVHLQLRRASQFYLTYNLWISEERAKPKFFPNDDALGEKKYQIKVVGHRVVKGTGEEGKDKLSLSVLYSRLDSLVRVSEFVKAPDVLKEYFNAEERQVAKTVYMGLAEVPVKLNPTPEEKMDEAKLLSAPEHILRDGEKGSNNISIFSYIFSVILNLYLFFQLRCRRKEISSHLKSKEITVTRNLFGTRQKTSTV